MDRTNAERQRRYISRLKECAARALSGPLDARIQELEDSLQERDTYIQELEDALGGERQRREAVAAKAAKLAKTAKQNRELRAENRELRAENRALGKWAEEEVAKAKKHYEMPRSVFNALANCLHPDKPAPTVEQRAEAFGLLTGWRKETDRQ